MERIANCLNQLRKQGKTALVSYVVAGDPGKDATLPVMKALVDAGVDILEIGVPFSDPSAEGPVIQRAHERALKHKTSLRDVLEMVAEFRCSNNVTPVVLMGYANPVEHMGYDSFVSSASQAGVDGLLTVDMPPEEAEELDTRLRRAGMNNIFLIAPTTSVERTKMICSHASGFIYYVSLKGVTGAGHLDVDAVRKNLVKIRAATDLPVCVGFGIKDGDSARRVARHADGVVVGSALEEKIQELTEQGITDPDMIAAAVASLATEIRIALDR